VQTKDNMPLQGKFGFKTTTTPICLFSPSEQHVYLQAHVSTDMLG